MATLAIKAIKLYQMTISRVTPPSCRFTPSCSQYGVEAIQQYGLLRGGSMTVWRILRCNPFSRGGYDPVR
jgi:putative membrane protein insertion efficiency factor